MSSVEKEVVITTIESMLKENCISITELPSTQYLIKDLQSVNNRKNIAFDYLRLFKDKIYELFDNNEQAYEWFCDNLDSSWRATLDIFKPKKFKIMNATIELNVAVPNGYCNSDIEEVVRNVLSDRCGEITIQTEEDDIDADDIERYDYENDPWEFCDCDFED